MPCSGAVIDEIIECLAGGDRATTQIKQEIAGVDWEVKRDGVGSRPQRHSAESAAAQRLAREWGGEHEVRTHYGTAVAKMLAQRLGEDVTKFLALVDKTIAEDIVDLLRSSVAARTGATAQNAIGPAEDEPALPFMRLLDAAADGNSK